MADLKPPHILGDERATMLTLFQYQRESFVRKVTGVSDDDARREFVGSGTSLLWLAQHMSQAEKINFLVRFAGQDVDVALRGDTIADAIVEYLATWERVDAVIAASSLDDMCRNNDRPGDVGLRWMLAHMLEETARHAGHADIIRELIDGNTGR
jgi:Protein of unknown function (DUF664)